LKFPEHLTQYIIPIATGIVLYSIFEIVMPTQASYISAVIVGIISVPVGIYIDRKFFEVA
jgi:hypothetical protein